MAFADAGTKGFLGSGVKEVPEHYPSAKLGP
jgi:hypothetical protein